MLKATAATATDDEAATDEGAAAADSANDAPAAMDGTTAQTPAKKKPTTKSAFKSECIFKSIDKVKQLVYGVVLEPDTEDTQGDVLSKAEIEKVAHNYLRDYRIVGDSHVQKADAEVVESFISPCDMLIGEALVSKGSWVMGVKVNDPALWQGVLDGEYTGFSIGGVGERVPTDGN